LSAANADSYQGQTQLSQLANDAPDDWQKYVRSPPNQIVRPIRVIANYTQGDVTNPDGLLTGKGSTIFTRTTTSNTTSAALNTNPAVVVDFGQNIVGFLSISFGGSSSMAPGRPGIRLAFSETLEFLGKYTSDFSRSYNVRSHSKSH
jgi:hypothetical protein